MSYQTRTPEPYQSNPFGFVYGDALTANVEGGVNVHPISYDASGVTVAANVYTPAGYSTDGSYAGICGGGGYALSAAQMDKRFKAVAVVSMFNTGSVRREGFQKSQADSVLKRLHDVADLRAGEVQSGELVYSNDMSAMSPEVGHNLPFDMYREGYEYYVETHAHPRSHARFAQRDLMDLFAWDPDDFMYLIDQPLLLVVGEKADTAYMSQSAFDAATGTEDKELYQVVGATHVDLYWRPGMVDDALAKLVAFYQDKI